MKPYTFCYFGSSGLELPMLGQAATRYRNQGGVLAITARTATQLFDNARVRAFVEDAMKADVVFINIHGGKSMCPAFDPLVEAIARRRKNDEKVPYLHLQPTGGDEESQLLAVKHTDGLDSGHWAEICRYYAKGSVENLTSLFYYFHKILLDDATVVPPVRDAVQEGLYHPSGQDAEAWTRIRPRT